MEDGRARHVQLAQPVGVAARRHVQQRHGRRMHERRTLIASPSKRSNSTPAS
jgi:hypothetical protein